MPDTIDHYIAAQPAEARRPLEEVRAVVRRIVPEAEEKISYQMPTMTLDGRRLVYFAAWKHHLAVYAIPPLGGDLEEEIAPYRAAKDTLRFPLDQPLPIPLIERLVTELTRRRRREAT